MNKHYLGRRSCKLQPLYCSLALKSAICEDIQRNHKQSQTLYLKSKKAHQLILSVLQGIRVGRDQDWEAIDLAHSAAPQQASQAVVAVKNPATDAGDTRDKGSIPGPGRRPGGGHGNPLQYSCLENSTDRGAWGAAVHRVPKSWTQLKRLSTHTRILKNTEKFQEYNRL